MEYDKLVNLRGTCRDLAGSASNAVQEVFRSIPDYADKAPKLMEWIAEISSKDDPLYPHEIAFLTNPLNYPSGGGHTAVKIVKLLNNLYDKIHANETAAVKKIVQVPQGTVVSKGGGSSVPASAALSLAFEKAKKTGSMDDWADYNRVKREMRAKALTQTKE